MTKEINQLFDWSSFDEILLKNLQDRPQVKSKLKKAEKENEIEVLKPTALRIDSFAANNKTRVQIKDGYDPTVNYYLKCWKTLNENEYLKAQIREQIFEIERMKTYLKAVNN